MTYSLNSLDLHITECIRDYPSLCGNRIDVLKHIFCCNGNGYYWVDGRAVTAPSAYDPDKISNDEFYLEEIAKETERMNAADSEEAYRFHRKKLASSRVRNLRRKQEALFIEENAEDLALITPNKDKPYYFYLTKGYDLMFSVPDDIKPDWLEGVREMILFIFRVPLKVAKNHPLFGTVNDKGQNQKQVYIEWCDEVLADLEKRFGKPWPKFPSNYAEWLDGTNRIGASLATMILSVLKEEKTTDQIMEENFPKE